MELLKRMQSGMQATTTIDFLGPLALRLYLVPVFWVAGTNKLGSIENVAAWFGNPDWGLGLPAPTLMAYLATYTEVLGAGEGFVSYTVLMITDGRGSVCFGRR